MKTTGFLGRSIGLLVFLLGIALLLTVFWQGWVIYQDPGLIKTVPQESADTVTRLITLVVRLAFLLIMCVASSLITSKGIQLYTASHSHSPAKSDNQKSLESSGN